MRAELSPSRGWAFNGRVLIERDREVEKLLELLADAVDGKVFCLVDAPDAETAKTVHRAAHGLVADAIYPVTEGD
jgi:uncharacterized protein DUF4242